MRGVKLMDTVWVAHIEYKNHPDTKLHLAAADYPSFLAAAAKVHAHCQEHWPFEIISLSQEVVSR